jgi:hypothetical protein
MSDQAARDTAFAYQRSPDVDEETFEEDLLLMHRQRRSVLTLNQAAAVLWEALRWPHSDFDLAALIVEACPGTTMESALSQVSGVLQLLLEGDFVIRVAP